jgi:FkbH-like protein
MLDWLPNIADFRGDLRAALAERHPGERLERLARLAQHRLGFLETIQLDRALGELARAQPSGFSSIRLAILASSTVDHLLPAIRIGGLRRRLLIDVYAGSYGQYRQELLDQGSPLYRFAPDVVLFSVTAREAIADLPLGATKGDAERSLAASVDGLRFLWRKARTSLNASVVQETSLNVADPVFGSYDRLVPGAPSRFVGQLNDRLSEVAAEESVLILDVARLGERYGTEAWFDPVRWLQAKMEIAPRAAPLYGDLVARILAAQRGLSKKCLVLDLDNTLWGGVVGDDGLDGIVLGQGSGLGEAYLGLQRYAKQLKERGVVLAVCSKNDATVAASVFRDHPEMILRLSDIAAFVVNWEDKAANLAQIAQSLNIGMDSLVFVDDNPVERARIRQGLPEVAVPELPKDPAHYVRCLAGAGYFEAVSFTAEDRQRAEQYAGNAQREVLRVSSESLDEFLRGLDMSMTFGPFAAVDLARVTQLINKTNQFNPTTRRYTAEEIAMLADSPDSITLQFRLLDKFGDNGLVSAIILRPDPQSQGVLSIDTWVMSCRVFGRQVEFEAMNVAVEAARRRGARALHGDYIPTAKNTVIAGLYPGLGFWKANTTPADGGLTRWALELTEYLPRQTRIARRQEHDR